MEGSGTTQERVLKLLESIPEHQLKILTDRFSLAESVDERKSLLLNSIEARLVLVMLGVWQLDDIKKGSANRQRILRPKTEPTEVISKAPLVVQNNCCLEPTPQQPPMMRVPGAQVHDNRTDSQFPPSVFFDHMFEAATPEPTAVGPFYTYDNVPESNLPETADLMMPFYDYEIEDSDFQL